MIPARHCLRRLPAGCAVLFCFFGASSIAPAQIWSEEFNAGSAPDGAVWTYELGNGCPNLCGWGNNELQNYTSDPANVRVENGNLIITAIRSGNTFTSARIKTLNKLTFQYGTVEARIKLPDLGNGLWPAFWTMGNNISSVGWPACGEIDIMEMGSAGAISANRVNRRVGSHAHWDNFGNYAGYGLTYDAPSDLDGSFHIYRMEWTPTAISTYIDGNWIWTIDISNPGPSSLTEFHQPHFFLLNMAVGGNYTGILNAGGITAPFPAEYVVDWIRIFDNGHTILGGSSQNNAPPVITSPLAANGMVDNSFSYSIVATASPTSYGATGLPAGLAINTSTGEISGTPTALGTSNVSISATNSYGTDTETLVLTISENLDNLSLNQSASASSFEPGNVVSNGNDSDPTGTRWAASGGTYPQWWRVDLGAQKLVSRVDIKWFGGTGRSYQYTIEVSDNDTAYTQVVDQTGNTTGDFTSDTFVPVAARYVRITVTGSTAGWASFYDASVFGTGVLSPGTIAFSSPTYSVAEGAANTTATITVQRTGGSDGAVGVTVSTTTGGSATAGADFTPTSTVLSWADGDTADKTVDIPILADSLAEGDEAVSLSLSSPTGGAGLGLDAGALTIEDRPFDAWRAQVFGVDANLPEAQAGADYDGDGLSNILEYSLDSDPTSPGGSGIGSAIDPGNRLQVFFTRNLAVTDVIFTVRAANDLPGSWQSIASKTGAAAWTFDPGVAVSDNPTTGEVVVTDSVLIGDQPRRFLQIQVEQITE